MIVISWITSSVILNLATNFWEEFIATMFYPAGGGNAFHWNVDKDLNTGCHNPEDYKLYSHCYEKSILHEVYEIHSISKCSSTAQAYAKIH
jgi:hypothetical protein